MTRFIRIRREFMGVSLLLLLLVGVSYGASDIPALRDAKDQAEKDRIQGLMNGARREGKLTIDAIMVEPKMFKYILEGFKSYYGLSVTDEFTYSSSARIITRVEQLLKAGRPTPDIVWNVSWAWYKDLIARGKMMRYDSPYYKDYTLSHKAGNSVPAYFVSDSYTFSPMWNPVALAKGGIKDFNPVSWWDFTDPKLGKWTSMGNISQSQSQTAMALGLRKTLGDEWFKKMAKLKPALYVKTAQGREWVASGEYPITIMSHAKNAEEVKKTGVQVKLLYPKEGVVLFPFAPIIMGSAPHPNTSKLFIDYIRSKPGADRMADAGVCLFPGRPGVKTPLREFLPPTEEIQSILMNWDVDDSAEAVKEMQQWVLNIGLSY
jgi:iron(III) transport system substrate-binding protein